jgi:hypothetical protein
MAPDTTSPQVMFAILDTGPCAVPVAACGRPRAGSVGMLAPILRVIKRGAANL